MLRADGRLQGELRPVTIQPDFLKNAAGSCLIACGDTRVLCTVSVVDNVPPFLRGSGKGWLTAEYAMLPASTGQRKPRDGARQDGRGVEIQRLIGRSLRQAVDLSLLGERTLQVDCDVVEADGGTRTASITGAFVALVCAVDRLMRTGKLFVSPIVRQIAAVSVGVVKNLPCLDLCYQEDSQAQVDCNIVRNDQGGIIEVQGTGEGRSFTRAELDVMMSLADQGTDTLMAAQREALGERAQLIAPDKPRLIVASANAGKLRELRALLKDRYDVISMTEAGLAMDIEETGTTFAQNAVIKAETVLRVTGCAALGDDSGLSVDALQGAPGVYSARYAGVHGDDAANNRLLLTRLADVPAPRTAHFCCAIALARPHLPTLTVQGECAGEILFAPRGEGGFGYDPLFGHAGQSFAEMPVAQKNRISHRARALTALLAALQKERETTNVDCSGQ